jgi:hypothetical protein
MSPSTKISRRTDLRVDRSNQDVWSGSCAYWDGPFNKLASQAKTSSPDRVPNGPTQVCSWLLKPCRWLGPICNWAGPVYIIVPAHLRRSGPYVGMSSSTDISPVNGVTSKFIVPRVSYHDVSNQRLSPNSFAMVRFFVDKDPSIWKSVVDPYVTWYAPHNPFHRLRRIGDEKHPLAHKILPW